MTSSLAKSLNSQALTYSHRQATLPNQEGVICSLVFPGLWLDISAGSELVESAMLNGNMSRVLDILKAGINSVEHQEFIQKLTAAQSGEAK